MSLQPSQQAAARELLRRRAARSGLVGFSQAIEIPGKPFDPDDEDCERFLAVETGVADHHRLVMEATERCIDTFDGRLMIFMPPGSAKSTYASVVAPVWAMASRPGFRVIGTSYGSDLAKKFGRRCRSIVRQRGFGALFGTALSPATSAADEWALTNGSEYMGAGILAGITGNRAELLVIDDPFKGRETANSPVTRKKTWEAYQDDLLTRLVPGGSIVLIQTRWHEEDLGGMLLPEDYDGRSGPILCRDGETWEVLNIPAKCERNDDPLGRAVGDYLWPEWFGPSHWRKFEAVPRTWSALFQQRPAPEDGDIFNREWFQTYSKLPPGCRFYGGSDYATKDGGGDWTVHVVFAVDRERNVYVVDLWRGQTEPDAWIEAYLDLVERWKPLGWAEERGQILNSIGPFLRTRMIERDVFVNREQLPSSSDKVERARSFQARMASGRVFWREGAPWLEPLMAEFLVFPNGAHDDQVDACTKATQLLDKIKGKRPEDGTAPPTDPRLARNAFAPRAHKTKDRI